MRTILGFKARLKKMFLRNYRLSLAKLLDKSLVKTQPEKDLSVQQMAQHAFAVYEEYSVRLTVRTVTGHFTESLDIFNTIKLIDLVTEKRGAETIEKNNQMYIHRYFKLSVLLINKCPFFCFRTSLLTQLSQLSRNKYLEM